METTELSGAATPESRVQAWEIWRTYGHSEAVMLAILERLLETVSRLEKGVGSEFAGGR